MKEEVFNEICQHLRKYISQETDEIERNRREINRLADKNTMLKRVRAQHIKLLSDHESQRNK